MSGASLGPVLGATPDVIAFDVLGTLFSLSALQPRLAEAGGDWRTFDEVAKVPWARFSWTPPIPPSST